MHKMNKKALLAVLLLISLVAFFTTRRAEEPGRVLLRAGPQAALPAPPEGGNYVLVGVRNTGVLQGLLGVVADRLPVVLEEEGAGALSGALLEPIRTADSLLDLAEETAILARPYFPDFSLHAAFFAQDAALRASRDDAGGFLHAAASWDVPSAGADDRGWSVPTGLSVSSDLADGTLERFYLLQRPLADGRSLVLLADTEAGVGEMLAALADPASRDAVERRTGGDDYVRFDGPFFAVRGEAGKWDALAEIGWGEKDGVVEIDAYSDLYGRVATFGIPSCDIPGASLPLLGEGTLCFLATLDLPYLCFLLAPDSPDPVEEVVAIGNLLSGGKLPSLYLEDLKALLRASRLTLSLRIDEGTGTPSALYAYVETRATDVLDKYDSVASFLLQPTEAEGWDRAASLAGVGGRGIALLRRGGNLLIGWGAPADYAVRSALPREIRDFESTETLFDAYARFNLLNRAGNTLGDALRRALEGQGISASLLDRLRPDALDTVILRHASPDRYALRLHYRERERP